MPQAGSWEGPRTKCAANDDLRSGPPKPIARTGERKNAAFKRQQEATSLAPQRDPASRADVRCAAQNFLQIFRPLRDRHGIFLQLMEISRRAVASRSTHKDKPRDRSLHLDHAERPQGLHRARGARPALHVACDRHLEGRAVPAGLPQDRAEQPHPGDRRPRQRHEPDGVGRDPDLSRRQDRQADREVGRGALPRDRVADVADGRPRADARPGAPLREVQQGQGALRRGALPEGSAPALWRARPAARPTANSSPTTTRSPTSRSGRGSRASSGRPSTSTSTRT